MILINTRNHFRYFTMGSVNTRIHKKKMKMHENYDAAKKLNTRNGFLLNI